ncbi:MdtA/MuxA family multidrug efflux RND transporter periplasmic adaptor subunit [Methylobacterium sp. J-068]|uniref:MdtA/MuxA family multidrug efflux RND transporter periplasmic adaptor subunit n=1 Tax=Methylobacterium sp. J-068 TaxID=2836649 RepID=UPI001FB99081|nr:MdtA/MuxA family multidrug efflux RND transporter periplasmic adaptor subunit [Methylobacterium sp. J-068]MCJ2036785.1 MdtA/MuxA family multidrug efflux RND transporter periplasmic adaptor subunit [Methylobacterium sp. J-068]
MNETSPIRTETAREYPGAVPGDTRSHPPVRRRGRARLWFVLLLVLAGAGYAGYRFYLAPKADTQAAATHGRGKGAGGRGAHGEPPQAVGIATVVPGDVPIVLAGLGTVTPLATVTVRSQISGYLTEIGFREGQTVKKGDFLAQIDSRPYEAQLAQYQGQLMRDQALLQNSKLDLARFQRLSQQDSISKQNVDTQGALVKQNEGTVAADQALVDQQKLNITYTRIVSPVEGRVGLRQIDQGNYITAASTSIVVVTQLHPISVVFTLPEDDVARVMRRMRSGAKLAVTAYDRGDVTAIATGMLDTVDNQIDTTTGTVKLRAIFENQDDALFPNQFVNAKLTVDTVRDAPIVPTAAILRGTPGTYVYLMEGDDKVVVRPIKLGEADGARTVVKEGLGIGDRVVVDGTDRLRDGAPVRVTEGAGKTARASGEAGAPGDGQTLPAAAPVRPGEKADATRADADAPEGQKRERRRQRPAEAR